MLNSISSFLSIPGFSFQSIEANLNHVLITAFSPETQEAMLVLFTDDLALVASHRCTAASPFVQAVLTTREYLIIILVANADFRVRLFVVYGKEIKEVVPQKEISMDLPPKIEKQVELFDPSAADDFDDDSSSSLSSELFGDRFFEGSDESHSN